MSASLAVKPTTSEEPSFWRTLKTQRELIENLVVRDIKTRYKQSVLGYAWAVLNPLIVALTYWLLFGIVLDQKDGTRLHFAIYTYYGLLVWNLFAVGLTTATESLVSHISLITKVYFPREVFPVSSVLSKLVDFAFGLVGLIPLLLIFHTVPSINAILALFLLIIPLLFTIGLGMLCACANLFFRDVRYLVTMILGLATFAVPNIYPLQKIADHGKIVLAIYLSNPIAVTIEAMRRLTFPITGDVSELFPYLVVATIISIITLVIGYAVFKRNESRFAEFI